MARHLEQIPGLPVAHWAVYRDAEQEDVDYPWFAEHRIVDSEVDLRHPHDTFGHSHGSFKTWRAAVDAALEWFDTDGCRDHERTWGGELYATTPIPRQ